ncbi:MAG: glycosyltransferase family 4 protein [Candidatus Levybacteria bacterium]|nr:glycosyltransferase family 4 protein [Candidatus Levybacteria bacterium]
MKIGIDARLWNEGGVGRYIRNLIKQIQPLDKSNLYTLFVLSKDYESIKYEVSSIKEENWELIKTNIRWHSIEEQLKFANILNKEELDLVHFPYISVPLNYQKPFIITIHDLIPYHYPSSNASALPFPIYFLKLLAYKFVVRAAARKAQKIIAPSNFTKKEIVEHLKIDPRKVIVTYEGVNSKITNSKSQIPKKSQNTKYKILNTKYFLYVGNAFPHKNLEVLIEAFNLFRQEHPGIFLVFVGKEDFFYSRLKNEVYKRKISDVVFLHNIIDGQLVSLYRSAIAFVSPSLMEGFGLPVLEAMVNRCLVLASDIPTHREICGKVALYFDPNNVGDLTQKLESIHSNDMYYYSEKKRGFDRAKVFSWEKMARETLKIYESCVGLRQSE